MKLLNLNVLVALVLVIWLLSEFGPEEASGAVSLCGIGIAAIVLAKLAREKREKQNEDSEQEKK